ARCRQFRIAGTWLRISQLSWDLNEYDQARSAANTAIAKLDRLATEQPRNSGFQSSLAEGLIHVGRLNMYFFRDSREAEAALRRAVEIFTQLTHEQPSKKYLVFRQADALN